MFLYPSSMNGVRRERSSIDNVIDSVTSIEQMKVVNRKTTAVVVDIKSAFDSVKHNAILQDRKAIVFGGRV